MTNELLFEIIQTVYAYYPVGLHPYDEGYVGTDNWRSILAEKMDRIDNADLHWNQFISALKTTFGEDVVDDLSFRQFPGFTAHVRLFAEGSDDETRRMVQNLVVDVSLLGKYFTVFLEDRYVFKGYQNFGREVPVNFYVLYNKSRSGFENEISYVQQMLRQAFPNYQFVPHKTLFDVTIKDIVPYDIPVKKKSAYNVYDLLMSDFYHNEQVGVLF